MDGEQLNQAYRALRTVFGRPVAEACLADPTLARLAGKLDRAGHPVAALRQVRSGGLGRSTVAWLSSGVRNPAAWLTHSL